VPDRVARQQTGARFVPHASASRHPERVVHIARYLSWLTPLGTLTVDDQRILGLVNAAGRPVHAGDLEDGMGEDPDDAAPLGRIEHAIV
jgi:hypothetical protein